MIFRKSPQGVTVFSDALDVVASLPIPARASLEHAWDQTVAVSADRFVFSTDTFVGCADFSGQIVWRFFAPPAVEAPPITCAYSADFTRLWLYLPDVEAGRGDHDRLLALDAGTGAVLTSYTLETTGQGGHLFARGPHMLLVVDEGGAGCQTFHATAETLHRYPWDDRSLADVAPDGNSFMTVAHSQEDVAFHALDDGAVIARTTLAAFEFGETIEWTGGYLDGSTAIVVISDDDSWQHFRVDPSSGAVLGRLEVTTIDPDDLQPQGDGTFLVTDTDGTLRRI